MHHDHSTQSASLKHFGPRYSKRWYLYKIYIGTKIQTISLQDLCCDASSLFNRQIQSVYNYTSMAIISTRLLTHPAPTTKPSSADGPIQLNSTQEKRKKTWTSLEQAKLHLRTANRPSIPSPPLPALVQSTTPYLGSNPRL